MDSVNSFMTRPIIKWIVLTHLRQDLSRLSDLNTYILIFLTKTMQFRSGYWIMHVLIM